MPTFTAVALERLIDPGERGSHLKTNSPSSLKQLNAPNKNNVPIPKKSSHIYFSPSLYTTPDPTPIPDYPVSVSPSPYVYNRKRRNFSLHENPNHGLQISRPAAVGEAISRQDHDELSLKTPVVAEAAASSAAPSSSGHQPNGDGYHYRDESLSRIPEVVKEPNGESPVKGRPLLVDDFFEPHASVRITSDDGGGNLTCDHWKCASDMSQSEFYDAREEFFSDGSSSLASPSSNVNIEAELRAIRVHLLEEIERRKQAEQAVADICKQWHLISQKMSHLGLSSQAVSVSGETGLDIKLAEQFCQEVVVARTVAEAVGRGCARAESEAAAEVIINSKNHEITRLRDKLQYYEAVNQEMSLRNQEVVEMARQGRNRRKRRLRWMWTCIGTSVVFGASALAYLYLPRMGESPLPASCEDSKNVHSEGEASY
ncbi:uncharacterized protein [Aristolochia californica]|uniref:uncharacterized protein n=1 Tax=Aristolochia californica TaxID=171875 RepID=UPI0035D537EE